MLGYTKQAMASPTVSVACSLSSIAIITILTKEGNLLKIIVYLVLLPPLTNSRKCSTRRIHPREDLPSFHNSDYGNNNVHLFSANSMAYECC